MLRPVLGFSLGALVFAAPAFAQTPERVAITLSGGYLSAGDYVDGEGNREDTGGSISSAFLELGGEVHLVRQANLTGTVGASFRLVDLGFSDDFGGSEGGLRPQTLGLYGAVANDQLGARLGLLLDVSRTNEPGELFIPTNSDAQTAFMLGLDGQKAFNATRVFGGLDAFLTLPDRDALNYVDDQGVDFGLADFDQGDVLGLHAGAGYRLRAAEVGLRLQYTYTTNASIHIDDADGLDYEAFGANADGTFEDSDRYQFSVIPYLTVRPGLRGLDVTLQGSGMSAGFFNQEYAPLGILIAGEATYAPVLPVSLRVRYGF